MFRADNRGRITIVELVTGVFSIGFIAALWPVVQDGIESNLDLLSGGEAYLMRLLLPLMVLVLLTVVFVTASSGGGR